MNARDKLDRTPFCLAMIPFMAFGAAIVFDYRGLRKWFTRKPGESDEYVKKFQAPAVAVGCLFLLLPTAAIIRSLIP